MLRFLAGEALWNELRLRARRSSSLIACVGFVGRHPERLMRWRRGDQLLVNVTGETVARGACSARGALTLLRKGVAVHQTPALHAKVYLFDRSAIVCSANLSAESRERLEEAGTVVTGPALAPIRAWVRRLLADDDTLHLDAAALAELARREPKHAATRAPPPRLTGRSRPLERILKRERVWLVATDNDEDETRDEERAAKSAARDLVAEGAVDDASDINWFNACGRVLRARVQPGDLVFEAWAPSSRAPHGRIVGPRACITSVDLGARFHGRRYRLALGDKRIWSRRLTAANLRELDARGMVLRRRGVPTRFRFLRGLNSTERRLVARLAGIN